MILDSLHLDGMMDLLHYISEEVTEASEKHTLKLSEMPYILGRP